MGIKVLVTGGRDYTDRANVYLELARLDSEFGIDIVIHGGAKGADSLASCWCYDNKVEESEHKANWIELGAKAGPLRNQEMVDSRPDVVLAFPGGRGTADCVRRAITAGIPVRYV